MPPDQCRRRLTLVAGVLYALFPLARAALSTAVLTDSFDLEFELETDSDKTCPVKLQYSRFHSQVFTLGTVDVSAEAFESAAGGCSGSVAVFGKPARREDVHVQLQEEVRDDTLFENVLYAEFGTLDLKCGLGEESSSSLDSIVDFNAALFARPARMVDVGFYLRLYPEYLYLFLVSDFSRRGLDGVGSSSDYCVYSVLAPETANLIDDPLGTTAPPTSGDAHVDGKEGDKRPSAPTTDVAGDDTSLRDSGTSNASDSGLGRIAIIGIAAGCIAAVVLVAAVVFWRWRR
jgi:hypothetical protein